MTAKIYHENFAKAARCELRAVILYCDDDAGDDDGDHLVVICPCVFVCRSISYVKGFAATDVTSVETDSGGEAAVITAADSSAVVESSAVVTAAGSAAVVTAEWIAQLADQ